MGWERLAEWFAPFIAGSLAWATAFGGAEPFSGSARAAPDVAMSERQEHLMIGWAQSTDKGLLAQAEAENQADAETLDEGAPPAQAEAATGEADVETLDQGSPPGAVAAPVAAPAAAAPAEAAAPSAQPTTAYAPAPAAGPTIPPGFGEGRVHVSAGRFGFPRGLESCHVGAVTGRAYVGIDCGDGDDVVGHAASFEDFPFVPEADFPFEGDEAFLEDSDFFAEDGGSDGGDDVVVSTGRGDRETSDEEDTDSSGSESATADEGDVEVTQRARKREPRVETNADPLKNAPRNEDASGSVTYQKAKKSQNDNDNNKAKKGNRSEKYGKSKSKGNSKSKAQGANKKHKDKNGNGKRGKHDNRKSDKGKKK